MMKDMKIKKENSVECDMTWSLTGEYRNDNGDSMWMTRKIAAARKSAVMLFINGGTEYIHSTKKSIDRKIEKYLNDNHWMFYGLDDNSIPEGMEFVSWDNSTDFSKLRFEEIIKTAEKSGILA